MNIRIASLLLSGLTFSMSIFAQQAKLPAIYSAEFDRSGKFIATAGEDGYVHIWNATTRKLVKKFLNGSKSPISKASFNKEGDLLITGNLESRTLIWDISNINSPKEVGNVSGGYIPLFDDANINSTTTRKKFFTASASADAVSLLYFYEPLPQFKVENGFERPIQEINQDDNAPYCGASFQPNGGNLVTVNQFGLIGLWDWQGKKLNSFPFDIATKIPNKNVDITMPVNGQGFAPFPEANCGASVSFGSSPFEFLSGTSHGWIHIWDIARNNLPKWSVEASADEIWSVAFNKDNTKILASGNDFAFQIWDVKTKKQILKNTTHTALVRSARFSPDNSYILTASDDGTARLWLTDGKGLFTFRH
jgi:WD40 repeat protein